LIGIVPAGTGKRESDMWLARHPPATFFVSIFLAMAGETVQAMSSFGAATELTTDYFAIFGLPRKLWIEMSVLEQKFLQLCWKLHPDNFVNAAPEEQELSLKRSSELNDAYRVLRDPVARVEYLLGIENMRKEGEHKQQAPPELLEEVFELNESLDELREAKASGGNLSALRERLESAEKSFQHKLGEVDSQLQGVAREWDAAVDANGDEAARRKIMTRLNELLNRRSYIRNLVANVQKELL
jgi:molecular chaperone HscB